MKKTVTFLDRTTQKEMYITAFSAVKQEYGLKIEVMGCVKLLPAEKRQWLKNNLTWHRE